MREDRYLHSHNSENSNLTHLSYFDDKIPLSLYILTAPCN